MTGEQEDSGTGEMCRGRTGKRRKAKVEFGGWGL